MTNCEDSNYRVRSATLAEELAVEAALHSDVTSPPFKKALEAAIATLKKLDWIPVERGLPEIPPGKHAVSVQFIDDNGEMRDAMYAKGAFHELLLATGSEYEPSATTPIKWRYAVE